MRLQATSLKLLQLSNGTCEITMDLAEAALLNRGAGILEQLRRSSTPDWEWILGTSGPAKLVLQPAHVRALRQFQPKWGLDLELVSLLNQAPF